MDPKTKILKMRLRDIPDIPARVRHCVQGKLDTEVWDNWRRRAVIRKGPPATVEDLVKYSADELMQRRCVGVISIQKTRRALRRLGLDLKASTKVEIQLQSKDTYVVRKGSSWAGGPFTQTEAEEQAAEAAVLCPGYTFLVCKVIKTYTDKDVTLHWEKQG